MEVNWWIVGDDLAKVSIDRTTALAGLNFIHNVPNTMASLLTINQLDGSSVDITLTNPKVARRDFIYIPDGTAVPQWGSALGFTPGRNFGGTITFPGANSIYSVINSKNLTPVGLGQITWIEGWQGLMSTRDTRGVKETLAISMGRAMDLGATYRSMYASNGGNVNLGTDANPQLFALLSPEAVATFNAPKFAPPVAVAS